jgi:hypothetical protein
MHIYPFYGGLWRRREKQRRKIKRGSEWFKTGKTATDLIRHVKW